MQVDHKALRVQQRPGVSYLLACSVWILMFARLYVRRAWVSMCGYLITCFDSGYYMMHLEMYGHRASRNVWVLIVSKCMGVSHFEMFQYIMHI